MSLLLLLLVLQSLVGISSSFITNLFRPGGEITRELTGTETLKYGVKTHEQRCRVQRVNPHCLQR
jgi:hypothetical protein